MTERDQQYHVCGGAALLIVILLALAALLTGCRTARKTQTPLPYVPIETSTDTKVIHVESIDTVFITPPAQTAERTTAEKESHLETDYAESDARINEDGTLTHTLKNKTQPKPVPVKNGTDIVYVDKITEKPIAVEVERELTWWERARMKSFWWLSGLAAILTAYIFRKPLQRLLRAARRLI